jgi:hypothetical protein
LQQHNILQKRENIQGKPAELTDPYHLAAPGPLFVNGIAFMPEERGFSLFCGANFAFSVHGVGQKGRNRLGTLTFSRSLPNSIYRLC